MTDANPLTDRTTFTLWAEDIARYGDTDRQGHINNAAFSTFLETGRVSFLLAGGTPLAPPACDFVIVRLELDFRREMHWGGKIEIGTVVLALGRSSFLLGQAIFQDGRCTATAQTRLVLMDAVTRRSKELPADLRHRLEALQSPRGHGSTPG